MALIARCRAGPTAAVAYWRHSSGVGAVSPVLVLLSAPVSVLALLSVLGVGPGVDAGVGVVGAGIDAGVGASVGADVGASVGVGALALLPLLSPVLLSPVSVLLSPVLGVLMLALVLPAPASVVVWVDA